MGVPEKTDIYARLLTHHPKIVSNITQRKDVVISRIYRAMNNNYFIVLYVKFSWKGFKKCKIFLFQLFAGPQNGISGKIIEVIRLFKTSSP